MENPSSLKYAETHEWVKTDDSGELIVGITDHAQDLLGDLVFAELPEVGQQVGKGDECSVVESVKAASDIYSPVTGEIVAVNGELEGGPEAINDSPYQDGWIFVIKPTDTSELDDLLDAEGYQNLTEDE